MTWRDVFGWNLPFSPAVLTPSLLAAMQAAGVLRSRGSQLQSAVRVASIGQDLFLHSAFPTNREDAVFFGPDTYRFARFIRDALAARPLAHSPLRILDIGCGSGAGGIVAARCLTQASGDGGPAIELVMNDINPLALQYAQVNAALAGVDIIVAEGDALAAVDGTFDLIVSNPPYLDDGAQRAYRHGGARLGRALSVRIASESLARLAPGGRLLLYTGVAIVDGTDPFLRELQPLLEAGGFGWHYDEIDPDIFGEELERPAYAQADRIAAVGLVVNRHDSCNRKPAA